MERSGIEESYCVEESKKEKEMEYYVYILTNHTNSVLYIGVTNNLIRRLYEHKNGLLEGFSKKYKTHKLIYFEQTSDVEAAINREKQLKGWTRQKKENLIATQNPLWINLEDSLY